MSLFTHELAPAAACSTGAAKILHEIGVFPKEADFAYFLMLVHVTLSFGVRTWSMRDGHLQELRIAHALAEQECEGGLSPRISPLAQVRVHTNMRSGMLHAWHNNIACTTLLPLLSPLAEWLWKRLGCMGGVLSFARRTMIESFSTSFPEPGTGRWEPPDKSGLQHSFSGH
jgi:hypothetical protein